MVFGPAMVKVEDGAVIRSFSHIEGAHIGKGVRVGPFARLRPGTGSVRTFTSAISSRSKRREIEAGAKANHLSYIGDARVGEGANVGAGTITCNYDGATSTAPRSAKALSSARTRRWWLLLKSAMAPMSARARW